MGTLRNLKSGRKNTHLLYTTSSLVEMYIYDILKEECEASSKDSIFTVNSKASFNEMVELCGVMPFLAKKWLFIIEYPKVKGSLKANKQLFMSESSIFLVKVSNYREYKEFKELVDSVNEMYLSMLRYDDIVFLFQGKHSLPEKLVDFISKSYSQDPELVFKILEEMDHGMEITSRKQITELCGASAGSINYFALSLLKALPTTEKGLKITIRNRVSVAKELAETYKLSTFRNFLYASVKDILALKEMYMQGELYDRVSEVPKVYDEKRLKKYNRYLSTIKEIPLDRIMKLYVGLGNTKYWREEIDLVEFIYRYYSGGSGYDISIM